MDETKKCNTLAISVFRKLTYLGRVGSGAASDPRAVLGFGSGMFDAVRILNKSFPITSRSFRETNTTNHSGTHNTPKKAM
jgi:hypothetical protein